MLNYFFEIYYPDGSLINLDSYRILLNSTLVVILAKKKIQLGFPQVYYTMKINFIENIEFPRECFVLNYSWTLENMGQKIK